MVVDRDSELLEFGCVRCVWRLNGVCPEGFGVGCVPPFFVGGICDRYRGFLLGLDDGGGLWEKFSLYLTRLQCLDDYGEFKKLDAEIRELERRGGGSREFLEFLDMKRNSLKLWWFKLNELALKGLGRVGDRVAREKCPEVRKLSVQQLNVLFGESVKLLEGKK